jgi:hypothetical protein
MGPEVIAWRARSGSRVTAACSVSDYEQQSAI